MPFDVESLPLELKIGQMMMAGYSGSAPPPHIWRRVSDGSLGGIILFAHPSLSASEMRLLTMHLQEAAIGGASGLPLLIATDQEGGRVSRLSPPLTKFPTARLIGAAGSEELAEEMGAAVAAELLAVGVNMNLAPVLDILTNPSNPAIGDRALGSNAELVARLGRALIRGMQKTGVMAVAKHFPGHGDTSFDSHQVSGGVGQPEAVLWRRELLPFRAAMEEGVEAVMTAHVIYSEVDPHAPATLSDKIITGILRGRMRYEGLVMTDDLEMKGIAGGYPISHAAVAAVSAGAGILLVCKERRSQEEAYRSVLDAAREGRVSQTEIDSSVKRILAAKEKYARPNYNIPVETVCCEEHQELARRISERGRQS